MVSSAMRKAGLVTAGVAVAGGAVFGATQAFAASPSTSSGTTATALAADASASTSKAKPCADAKHPARCAVRRDAARDLSALFKRGAHGQSTVKDKAGAYVVREWQVGKVASISGSSVVVTDGSGATWTWTVQSATTYHVDGKKGSLSGVHVGDTILIRGRQSGSANDATALRDPNQSKLG